MSKKRKVKKRAIEVEAEPTEGAGSGGSVVVTDDDLPAVQPTKYDVARMPCKKCGEVVLIQDIECAKCLSKHAGSEKITLRQAAEAIDALTGTGLGDAVDILMAVVRGDRQSLERLMITRSCPSCGRMYRSAKLRNDKEDT
jgi:hypothetical protein